MPPMPNNTPDWPTLSEPVLYVTPCPDTPHTWHSNTSQNTDLMKWKIILFCSNKYHRISFTVHNSSTHVHIGTSHIKNYSTHTHDATCSNNHSTHIFTYASTQLNQNTSHSYRTQSMFAHAQSKSTLEHTHTVYTLTLVHTKVCTQ